MLRSITFRILSFLMLTGLLIPFQNCANKGFQAYNPSELSSSAQCMISTKAEGLAKIQLVGTKVDCSDFNQYICERRVFEPGVSNLSHSVKECVGSNCVDVDVFEYDTNAARAGASPAAFQPGGDYNHQEVHCRHRFSYKGVAVYEGSSDNLGQALAEALAACEKGT